MTTRQLCAYYCLMFTLGLTGCTTSTLAEQDLGVVHGVAYQQTESRDWLSLQRLSPHVSADVKPEFLYCTPRWFMCLERGMKIQHSPCEDGTSVLDQEMKSLHQASIQ